MTTQQEQQLHELDKTTRDYSSYMRQAIYNHLVPIILKTATTAKDKYPLSLPLIYDEDIKSQGYILMELYRHYYFASIQVVYAPNIIIPATDYKRYYNAAIRYYSKAMKLDRKEFLALLQEYLYTTDTKEIK